MKRVFINSGEVGLLFNHGGYQRILTKGKHWISSVKTLEIYSMSQVFKSSIDLNILLKDSELAEMLEVMDVGEGEIMMIYENGIHRRTVTKGRYAFWKGLIDYQFKKIDIRKLEVDPEIDKLLLKTSDLINFVRTIVVPNSFKGLLYVNGSLIRILDPGDYYFWDNANSIVVERADTRQLNLEISGQEILTKDKAGIRINFQARYKIIDIKKAVHDNKTYEKQLYSLFQLALREFMGTLTLDEILERKTSIAEKVLETMQVKVPDLGVEIIDCGVKDIILPGDMKEIMNRVLIADKINSFSISGGHQLLEQFKHTFVPE